MKNVVAILLTVACFIIAGKCMAQNVGEWPQAEVVKILDSFPADRFSPHVPLTVSSVSNDGASLIVGPCRNPSGKPEIIQWSIADGKIIKAVEGFWGIADSCLSADGRILAFGRIMEGDVLCWDLKSGKTLSLKPVEKLLSNIALSPDGKYLAAVDSMGNVKLLQTSAGKKDNIRDIGSFKTQFGEILFSNDGKLLAGIQGRGRVNFWQIPKGTELAPATFPPAIHFAAFDSPSQTLYGLSLQGLLATKKMGANEEVEIVDTGIKLIPPYYADLSKDGKTLAISGILRETKKNLVILWNMEEKKGILQYESSGEKPLRIDFMPDGSGLVVFGNPPFILGLVP